MYSMTTTTTMDGLGVNIGDTVNFWIHASDESYTGTVEDILILNGSLSMLILCNGSYRLVSLASIYGLSVTHQARNDADVVDDVEEHHDIEIVEVEEHQSSSSMLRQFQLHPHAQQIIVEDDDEQEAQEEVTCPICLDSIDMNQNAMSTDCGHKFHFTCIMKNMAANSAAQNACPLCREPVMQGFSVTNDDESVNRLFKRLTQERSILMNQVERRRLTRMLLSHELSLTEQMQSRVLGARRVLHESAFQIINQHARDIHLSETITSLVASAANNNIRENYDELYEFYHDEIQNMCFNLCMRIMCGRGQREEPAHSQARNNQVQLQDQPIIVD